MGITQALNSKANVKKLTNEDLPFSGSVPVMNSYYAVSTAAQTVINLTFSVDQTLTDQFFLFVDGKKLRLGASNDYTFTAIAADNTSTQVTLNYGISANLNIQAYNLGLKAESEFLMDNRFVQLYAAQSAGFQGFIDTTSNLITATTTTGSPVAGTFYSSIIGRNSIPDLSQDLGVRMGINRIMTQSCYQLPNEFGANGEPIWGITNDIFGQIRAGGTGWAVDVPGNYGQEIYTTTPGDFIEITFYGTGLNVLTYGAIAAARSATITVDGVAAGTFTQATASTSTVLGGRNYSPNVCVNAANGLALGIHTVKLTVVNVLDISGFEIINTNSSNILVNPGSAYIQGKKYATGTASIFAYNSIATGTRGGRVLVYQNGDGSIGKAWQPTNTSSALLTSADHTNEEVSRTYLPREFGAGRGDDFSRIGVSPQAAAFTLDDGTATFMTTSGQFQTINGSEGVAFGAASNSFFLNFVGTGLDMQVSVGTLAGASFTYSIDGSAPATISFTNNAITNVKIVSGLPYGTHTFKLTLTAITSGLFDINKFIVYQPKKPTLPSGTIELADYNVMANFSANTIAGSENIATGVLRKASAREMLYTGGSWTAAQTVAGGTAGSVVGFRALGSATGQVVSYTFFGTGFDIRWSTPVASNTFTMAIDGTNPTAAGATATGFYGAITSFVAGTGVVTSNGTGQFANGTWVSGLPLGLHTVTWTQNAATSYGFESIDLIVPIHSVKNNIYADLQNALPIGSQSISDNRKLTPVKDSLPSTKAWAQAIGITSNPTTTATSPVPMPDMSVAIRTNGGPLRIMWESQVENNGLNQIFFAIYVDGIQVSQTKNMREAVAAFGTLVGDHIKVPVAAGYHKVDVYWWVGAGTSTADGTGRILLVEET